MIVYLTKNKVNSKIYIGQDSKNNPNYLGSGVLIKKAIRKYGKSNFKKIILCHCKSKRDLDDKELYFQDLYLHCFQPNGYNISIGQGDSISNNPSKPTICKKRSKNQLGKNNNFFGKKHTKDAKRRMSLSKKSKYVGKGNPNFGKTHSIKTRKKISKALRGISYEERYGKKKALIMKQRMSLASTGRTYKAPARMFGDGNPSKCIKIKNLISRKKKLADKTKYLCNYCNRKFTIQNYIKSHGESCNERKVNKHLVQ